MAKSELKLLDIASDTLAKDLSTVLTMPVESLRALNESLDSLRGFKIRSESEVIKQWKNSGQKTVALANTCSVLRHLFEYGVEAEKSPVELLGEIGELCAEKGLDGFDERHEILLELLSPSDQYLHRKAVLPWTQNANLILVALDSAVELRGAYRSSKSEELLGLVPLAILRIATKYDDDEKGQVRRLALQLTEEDIDHLIDTLQRSKRRLAALKRYVGGTDVQVYDELIRGQWKPADDA